MKCLVTKLNAIISGGDTPILDDKIRIAVATNTASATGIKYLYLSNFNTESSPIEITLEGATFNQTATENDTKNFVDGVYNNAFTKVNDTTVQLNGVYSQGAMSINEDVALFNIRIPADRVDDLRFIDVADLTLFEFITANNSLYNVNIRNNKAINIDDVDWVTITPNIVGFNVGSVNGQESTGNITNLPTNLKNISIYGAACKITCKLSDVVRFPKCASYNIQSSVADIDVSIEELIGMLRNAGRTSGTITITLLPGTVVSFNSGNVTYGNNNNKTLSWTDTTITFDGITINA